MELLAVLIILAISPFTDCYDPLDPDGNIAVTFDIYQWTTDGYMAKVTLQNNYQYRHVEKPGWRLGWVWPQDEVIWSVTDASATHQGNCSTFKDNLIPHSCRKDPNIVDSTSSGILSASAIHPSKSFSTFEIKVGNVQTVNIPQNISLMTPGPGYTCTSLKDVVPTVYPDVGGMREMQVFRTWKSTCTYSPFVANKAPTCCVSLSTFYNPNITPCQSCSCGCRVGDKDATSCLSENFSLVSGESMNENLLQCTDHMCPISVHWHLKSNYKDHWRVKVTVSNYNYGRNYTDWNLLLQHPGLTSSPTVYSFNSTMLPTVGFADEVALFWGISNYNQVLLQAGSKDQVGSITSEIVMAKNSDTFTLTNGWGLPRRVYFNGETCEMPLAHEFPSLPNAESAKYPFLGLLIASLFFSL